MSAHESDAALVEEARRRAERIRLGALGQAFNEGNADVMDRLCDALSTRLGREGGGGEVMFLSPLVSFEPIRMEEANEALVSWGHKMGPLKRPTPSIAHGLCHNGRLVAVVTTDHLAAAKVAGLSRDEALELSRVCAERPDLCRVALRLWREFVFPPLSRNRKVRWAISYQDTALHRGDLYRFDGWVKLAFSHSGADTRNGRPGRDKIIWGWCADPTERARLAKPKLRSAA